MSDYNLYIIGELITWLIANDYLILSENETETDLIDKVECELPL